MTTGFFRFPHTPHLAWLGSGSPRDDKVLSGAEVQGLLAGDVVVEEKVDGANLGFSFEETGRLQVQSRGQFLTEPYGGQFARLSQWIRLHGDSMTEFLKPHWIGFGEWCAARHSLDYDRLPDWWLMFDLYDGDSRSFLPTASRNTFAEQAGLATVVELFRGRTTLPTLERLLMSAKSRYRTGALEGIVVRSESPIGRGVRAKLVRPDFAQSIQRHWRSRRIEWNSLGAPIETAFGVRDSC